MVVEVLGGFYGVLVIVEEKVGWWLWCGKGGGDDGNCSGGLALLDVRWWCRCDWLELQ